MRKLTKEEISKLADIEGVDKEVVKNFLEKMELNPIDALDEVIQSAKMFKWNKATILTCVNGILLSDGLIDEIEISKIKLGSK